MKESALVVLSGGQDSTTCLYWAKQEYASVSAITFDYGQIHKMEIDAAMKIGEMADVAVHCFVHCAGILQSVSPLLDTTKSLEKYENHAAMEQIIGNRVETTFVPMRNALFLTIAANYAVFFGIKDIVTGVCQEDNANYPDCTAVFIMSMANMIRSALASPWMDIITPLMYMSKAKTVQLAHSLPGCWEALAFSHTSYDGKYPPIDMNHANVLRAHGFEEAGLPDPLVLRAVAQGLMEVPSTKNYSKEAMINHFNYAK